MYHSVGPGALEPWQVSVTVSVRNIGVQGGFWMSWLGWVPAG